MLVLISMAILEGLHRGSFLAPWLLRLSAVDSSSPLLAPAQAYLVPRLWGSPALLTLIVLQATLSGGFRDTRAVLHLVLLGATVNGLLTPLGVWLGGVKGAAWATTLACYVSALWAWRMLRGRGDWLPRCKQLTRRVFFLRGGGQAKGWAARPF